MAANESLSETRLWESVKEDPTNFPAWTALLAETEKTSTNDLWKICQVYDSFLQAFPLCYGYWKKYADHKARMSTTDEVVAVYERAIRSITYSVGLWVCYCSFATMAFRDPGDVRRLFEQGISFVGRDYLCHHLWDKYIEFEYIHKQWNHLAVIYLQTLQFPSKKLQSYYERFKEFCNIWEGELKCENGVHSQGHPEDDSFDGVLEIKRSGDGDISSIIKELLEEPSGSPKPEVLNKYVSVGEELYQDAKQMDAIIQHFEKCIRRPYFHVKALDDVQLENWHRYLDFVEKQHNFDWTVRLYERCLICCANYPEFWIRYVLHMEAEGGREISNFALSRACEIFLKRSLDIHLFSASFKEQVGNISGARSVFLDLASKFPSDFVEIVIRNANMEKRQGNVETALVTYENALALGSRKVPLDLSTLYEQYSRFTYRVTGSIDRAREVLVKGVQRFPQCKTLLKGLVHFELMHGGPEQIPLLESLITQAIIPESNTSPSLSGMELQEISRLFVEFVDLCGTIPEILKAWDRHKKLFPHVIRETSSYKWTPMDVEATRKPSGSPHHFMSSQETPDIQAEQSTLSQPLYEEDKNGIKMLSQHVQCLGDVGAQSRINSTAQIADANVTGDSISESKNTDLHSQPPLAEPIYGLESSNNAQDEKVIQNRSPQGENSESIECVNLYKTGTDLQPPPFETLSISCDTADQFTPPGTNNQITRQSITLMSPNGGIDGEDKHGSLKSDPACTSSDGAKQIHGEIPNESTPTSVDSNLHVERQVPPVPNSLPDPHASHVVNWPCVDPNIGFHRYPPHQHQQWLAPPLSPCPPTGIHFQMAGSDGYSSQPQPWQIAQACHVNPMHVQYQIPTQAHSVGANSWPMQNMQQDNQRGPMVILPNSLQQPPQHYQYPPESIDHYGGMHSNPEYAPHIWHYPQQNQQQQPQVIALQQQQQQPQIIALQQEQQPQQPQVIALQQQQQQQQYWNHMYYSQQMAYSHYYASNTYGQEYGQHPIASQGQGHAQPQKDGTLTGSAHQCSHTEPPLNQ
ncbi:uncharacterized protein LOC18440935 isoform X1 [Amborella trichopoda]|uniref:uncharacterized protein LOC18440935 isoform X1 n=1 Tax=Amborella trichopoda TaxID=13333 RepID=UPI0005D3F7AA|nr:uncharacterized protein LOC18440935 isoform X1 [Amborella trichopoda]|eukprot:XP_011625868.1 uncharacterized protein LOC18440935 isoform X1 [Amborella trichopoda]